MQKHKNETNCILDEEKLNKTVQLSTEFRHVIIIAADANSRITTGSGSSRRRSTYITIT